MKRLILSVSILIASLTGLALVPQLAQATINPQLSFQGKLTNPDGTNVTDGNFSIRFRIYTDPTADAANTCVANSCKWEETQATVSVSAGLFNVNLGSSTSLPGSVDFNTSALYLGIKVGSDAEMTPRVRLTAAPYAFNSELLDGLDSAALGQLAATQTWAGANTFQPTGNVTGLLVKQSSTGSPTADIFNVQTANNTNVIQITGPSANNAAVTISAVGASSALTLQSSNTISIGNNAVAQTINVGNGTGATAVDIMCGTGVCRLGQNAIAHTITIGNTTGASAVTIDSGTGAISIGTGAQARSLNIGTGAAAQAATIGSTNTTSSLDLQAGTGGIDITTQGTGAINIGNNAIAQTINIGNGTGTTTVAVLCGTGACGFGNNATTHTTTLGSSSSTSNTILQAGTGGISLTSGANITIGTADAVGTLLVLDSKSGTDPTATNGGMYYNSTNNKFRCAQNSLWADCTTGFNANVLAADQAATQNSTTMQNVSALGFTANANTTYAFDAWVPVNNSTAATDLRYTFTTPAGATLGIMTQYIGTTSATTNTICNISASAQACRLTNVSNYAYLLIQVRGFVTVAGTAGTVQFQFAQDTATAGQSFPVVKKGATITWKQSN